MQETKLITTKINDVTNAASKVFVLDNYNLVIKPCGYLPDGESIGTVEVHVESRAENKGARNKVYTPQSDSLLTIERFAEALQIAANNCIAKIEGK